MRRAPIMSSVLRVAPQLILTGTLLTSVAYERLLTTRQACWIQIGAWVLHLVWKSFGLHSYHKWITPGFVSDSGTDQTSEPSPELKRWSQFTCLVCTRVRWFVFSPTPNVRAKEEVSFKWTKTSPYSSSLSSFKIFSLTDKTQVINICKLVEHHNRQWFTACQTCALSFL